VAEEDDPRPLGSRLLRRRHLVAGKNRLKD
jgi:hypothetical protein